MQRKQIVLNALAAALLNAGFLAGAALGGEKWKAEHPRRAEVNHRLHNQNARINEGLKTGKLTSQQAQGLHQQDHQIRQEERADAAQNGGHMTWTKAIAGTSTRHADAGCFSRWPGDTGSRAF